MGEDMDGMPGNEKHKSSKSRRGSQNVMKTHAKNNYHQQSGVDMNGHGKVNVKGISNKLEDYYSTSSDTEQIDEESTDDSSTIASTDSDDEQNAHLDSSTDESSIVSDILKEGANIPALNDMEGPMNNLNLEVAKKKKKKKRKKDKKSAKKSKKKRKKKKKKGRENSVSKSKSKRKKKEKEEKEKEETAIGGFMECRMMSLYNYFF